MKFTREPSKRHKVKSRRERVTDTDGSAEAKVPDIEESEVKKTDEDFEEIDLDQPYDDRYVSILDLKEFFIHSLLSYDKKY